MSQIGRQNEFVWVFRGRVGHFGENRLFQAKNRENPLRDGLLSRFS